MTDWDQRSHRVTRIKRAGFVVYDHNLCLVSSSSSSFFLSATRIAIAHTCLDRYSSNLVKRIIDRKGTLGCDQFGVKGHVGVTKVNDIYCVKKLKQGQMEKLNMSSCRPWWKLKSIQLHRCHMTFGFGVKGQNVQFFSFFQKTTSYKQVELWCCDWHICILYGQCLWVV